MATIAIQLIDAQRVGELQDYLAVLEALGMDDPEHKLVINMQGTIEVHTDIASVNLPAGTFKGETDS